MPRDSHEIHLYCLCWNEEDIIPFFLHHYSGLVDRFHILDNGSTDRSLRLLAGDERIRVTHFDVPGDSFVAEEQRISDTVWHASRGVARWVVMIDMDEFLYHPDLACYLRGVAANGVSAIRAIGYDMVATGFPGAPVPLHQAVTKGVRSLGLDKPCVFDPDRIEATNFRPGRHSARFSGEVIWPDRPEISLLHYKQMGLDYLSRRNALLASGLKPRDIANKWGFHYALDPAQLRASFEEHRACAQTVPGLRGGPPHTALGAAEHRIRVSSRFDQDWYLRQYPDVARSGFDPAAHYCLFGEREGRRPSRAYAEMETVLRAS